MSRKKKKRPLPPRTLRMDRKGRLSSARPWLAAQRGRPPERIARSYRKRYGVDWVCAIQELSALGIAFDPKWRKQLKRTLENQKRARERRREEQKTAPARPEIYESDATFASIAGYTEGGAPYGTTWEEREEMERRELDTPAIEQPLKRDMSGQRDDDSLPF